MATDMSSWGAQPASRTTERAKISTQAGELAAAGGNANGMAHSAMMMMNAIPKKRNVLITSNAPIRYVAILAVKKAEKPKPSTVRPTARPLPVHADRTCPMQTRFFGGRLGD